MSTPPLLIHLPSLSMPQSPFPPSRIHRLEPIELCALSFSLSILPLSRIHRHPTPTFEFVSFSISTESMFQIALKLTLVHSLSIHVVFRHCGIVEFGCHSNQSIHLVHTHSLHISILQLETLPILIHVQLIIFTHTNQLTSPIHFLEEPLHAFHRHMEEVTTLYVTEPRSFLYNLPERVVHNHLLILKHPKHSLDPSILIYTLSLHLPFLVVVAMTLLVQELIVILSRTHKLSAPHNLLVIVPLSALRPLHLRIPLTVSIVSNPNDPSLLVVLSEQS